MTIDTIVRDQHGLITRGQAAATGMSPAAIDDRLRRRCWRPVLPAVYLAGARAPDPAARLRAALLWAGGQAVLTGAAAAWWWGLSRDPPPTIVLALPDGPDRPQGRTQGRRRPGVVAYRRPLAAADVACHRGLPLAARPLAVLEAAVEIGPPGAPLLDRTLRGGLSCPEVHAALARNPSAAARRVLDNAASRAAAEAGALLIGHLRDAGVTGWHLVPRALHASGPTVAFPAARLAVVATGWATPCPTDPPAPMPFPGSGWRQVRVRWSELQRSRDTLAVIARALDGEERG